MKSKDKRLLDGGKFGKRHTTYLEAAVDFIKAAKERPEVTKIVLGRITQASPGRLGMTFKTTSSGLKVIFRGPRAVQEFFLTTYWPNVTQERLMKDLLE